MVPCVTGPVKVNHLSAKIANFCLCINNYLCHHNKIFITTAVGFLLQLTELGYYILHKDINENMTWCNLHSHG